MHYHGESMTCLTHADEHHLVQNDNICPICTLVVDADFDTAPSFNGYLVQSGFVVLPQSPDYLVFEILSEPGRAPPFMA